MSYYMYRVEGERGVTIALVKEITRKNGYIGVKMLKIFKDRTPFITFSACLNFNKPIFVSPENLIIINPDKTSNLMHISDDNISFITIEDLKDKNLPKIKFIQCLYDISGTDFPIKLCEAQGSVSASINNIEALSSQIVEEIKNDI